MNASQPILNPNDIKNKVQRIALEIMEAHPQDPLAFVGIHTRGVILAQRVYDFISTQRSDIVQGTVDITLYRDDLDNLGTIPSIQGSDLPFAVEGAHIILFDDVLFTGRTIRAALAELIDYGRPTRIELAVLIDRGNRELPICPDYLGHSMKTRRDEHVVVCFQETDGDEGVYLIQGESR